MENLQIRISRDSQLVRDALLIREEVFQKGQGVSKELDVDGKDGEADHLVAYFLERPIGCARIRYVDSKAKLERIGVLSDFRGRKIGQEIMASLVDYARAKNILEIYFDAQKHAQGFYEKTGFTARGEVFQEAGIPHIEMFMLF